MAEVNDSGGSNIVNGRPAYRSRGGRGGAGSGAGNSDRTSGTVLRNFLCYDGSIGKWFITNVKSDMEVGRTVGHGPYAW